MKIIMFDGSNDYGLELKIDYAPRVGESIYINYEVYTVENVIYNIADSEIYVYAKLEESKMDFCEVDKIIEKAMAKRARKIVDKLQK